MVRLIIESHLSQEPRRLGLCQSGLWPVSKEGLTADARNILNISCPGKNSFSSLKQAHFSSEDDHSHIRVVPRFVEGPAQLLDSLWPERISSLWPVDRDLQRVAAAAIRVLIQRSLPVQCIGINDVFWQEYPEQNQLMAQGTGATQRALPIEGLYFRTSHGLQQIRF